MNVFTVSSWKNVMSKKENNGKGNTFLLLKKQEMSYKNNDIYKL